MPAKRKPRSEWSESYRQRIERAERRAREEGVPFNRTKARGHGVSPKQEYKKRKTSEKKRAGKFYPLTPAEIRQLRTFNPPEEEIQAVADMPTNLRKKFLAEQRYFMNHPDDPRDIPIETMKKEWPEVPDVLWFYHSWR